MAFTPKGLNQGVCVHTCNELPKLGIMTLQWPLSGVPTLLQSTTGPMKLQIMMMQFLEKRKENWHEKKMQRGNLQTGVFLVCLYKRK